MFFIRTFFIIILCSFTLYAEDNKIQNSAIQKRIIFEKSVRENPFVILPHKPNYLLPMSYSKGYNQPYQEVFGGKKLDNIEAKFQVSMKYVAVENLFIDELNLLFAFTSISWWQSYNSKISSPFRETNYEPEMILSYTKPWSFLNIPIKHSFISLNHQSNGKSGSLSRSWNRVIAGVSVEHEDIMWNLESWFRFSEDSDNDDNPNIEEYLGYGQLGIVLKLPKNNNVDIALRNNFKRDNRGSIELGWSFPLTQQLRGYVQYFNGYGEGLIYYNHSSERMSLGIKLTDWL